MDLSKQIKELELEEQKLAERKRDLTEKQKLREALEAKMEQFFSGNNFSPKDLAEALIEKYGLRIPMRKPGDKRRKRTTVTAELRDEIKNLVNSGQSMNSVSKQRELSYAVVVKILKGNYDHLRSRPHAAVASA